MLVIYGGKKNASPTQATVIWSGNGYHIYLPIEAFIEMLETQLHFISAIAIFLAAVVPIYLTLKLKDNLRRVTLILTIFILTPFFM